MNRTPRIRKPGYFQACTELNRTEQRALTLLILILTALALATSRPPNRDPDPPPAGSMPADRE